MNKANLWRCNEMKANYARGLYKEYELVLTEKEKIEAELKAAKLEYRLLQRELARQKEENKKLKEKGEKLEEENAELVREIARLKGILNIDGTNSGIPTSQTPISKKKVIPNSRKKSSKKVGAQPGHAKKKLEKLSEEEITEKEIHKAENCPFCGSDDIEVIETKITKDEIDYEFVAVKRRHYYPECRCNKCGKRFRVEIATELKEENQYGKNVQALAMSLMNVGNVSINKVQKMIYGLSESEIDLSEGYIAKLQKRGAKRLEEFEKELKKRIIKLNKVYWDDTVIHVDKARACLRFYGDEKTALYTAHQHKDKNGLDEDGLLKLLPKETVVMHDHNRVNYNEDYSFTNVECNVHLLRDLEKTRSNLGHKWSKELKELLEETNKERNEAIEKGEEEFTEEYVNKFFEEYNRIMLLAIEENKEDKNKYYSQDELTLIVRLGEYKENYLAWVTNFEIPFSNNLSERSLRGTKSKMKISGQFKNVESARWYAKIKSYTETCARNGINETEALNRLCEGNPYTIEEIYSN